MLSTEIFLNYLSWSEGKAIYSILADGSGLNERTWRNSTRKLSKSSLKKIERYSSLKIKSLLETPGISKTEVTDWLANHPINTQSLACYSALVYQHQQYGSIIQYPETLKFAKEIDNVSALLIEERKKNDLHGFKQVLLGSFIDKDIYLSSSFCSNTINDLSVNYAALVNAETWGELEKPFKTLIGNCLISLIALWDVEFGTQVYFKKLVPRSCFEMVLPGIDPKEVHNKTIKKKRALLRFPIRRLIDFVTLIGLSIKSGNILEKLPELKRVSIETGYPEQTLKKWRFGAKRFKRGDFSALWISLCSESKSQEVVFEPWPLFVAAIMFQEIFTEVDKENKSNRSIWLIKDDYLPWWNYHFDKLKARGCTFGTTPWPDCFNDI